MPAESVAAAQGQRLDPAASARLYAAHADGVRRYLRVLGAGGELDDLVQQTFVVLLERPFEQRSEAATAAFLRSTARHLFLRRNRGLLPQVEAADEVWDRCCGDRDGQGYVDALRVCLQQLGGRARSMIELRYGHELGRDGVARALGMKPDGVKTALRRIRAALKACIERRLS